MPHHLNPRRRRLDGGKPNNGYVDGKLVYNNENSLNVSFLHNPYQKDSSSPVWQFGTIYRMNPDGSGIELFASGRC